MNTHELCAIVALGFLLGAPACLDVEAVDPVGVDALQPRQAHSQYYTTPMPPPGALLAEGLHSYVLGCDDSAGECFDMHWCGPHNIRMKPVTKAETNPNWLGIPATVCDDFGTNEMDIACVCCKPDSCMDFELGCVPCGNGQLCDDETNQCYCSDPDETVCNGECVPLDEWNPDCGGLDPCALRCDGKCVVDPESDPDHCGACENACEGGRTCQGGACGCPAGWADCGSGQCDTNLLDDDEACGACDRACPSESSCNGAGTCACDDPGARWCSGECVVTALDAKHCGQCGHACDPGDICNGGVCCGETVQCQ